MMYRLLRKIDNEANIFRWLTMTECYLSRLGMNNIWEFEGHGFSNEYVKLAVKRRISDIFIQEWNNYKSNQFHCSI